LRDIIVEQVLADVLVSGCCRGWSGGIHSRGWLFWARVAVSDGHDGIALRPSEARETRQAAQ